MARFPYAGLPPHQVWKRAVTDVAPAEIDPQLAGRFRFDRAANVTSAGSCFANRIADALRLHGFRYLITEDGTAAQGYGRFGARYGEIYTTLQLAQTVERAFGLRGCDEPPWTAGGRLYDPLRPRAVPGGFADAADLAADRQRHFAAVRALFAQSDVFIFTLGLTETWCARSDGTAFPLCPGAGIGTFDDERYVFRNLDVDDNVRQFERFLDVVRAVNPGLRIILTVSPVPLAATMEPQHVVAATAYSKAVLRVAAETLRRRHAAIDYFASFEIVSARAGVRDAFGPDGRDVSDDSVERVMRSFFRAFTDAAEPAPPPPALAQIELSIDAVTAASNSASSALCNEAYLATFISESVQR